jgi:hypothetical protein
MRKIIYYVAVSIDGYIPVRPMISVDLYKVVKAQNGIFKTWRNLIQLLWVARPTNSATSGE